MTILRRTFVMCGWHGSGVPFAMALEVRNAWLTEVRFPGLDMKSEESGSLNLVLQGETSGTIEREAPGNAISGTAGRCAGE